VFPGRGEQPVGLGEGVRDGLLDQDVHAFRQAVDRDLGVPVVRGADVHHVGAERLDQTPVIVVRRHVVPGGGGRGPGRIGVADADQIDVRETREGGEVHHRHVAAADHRRGGHYLTPPAVRPPTR